MEQYSIGIDFGTQEVRAMLVDRKGHCMTETSGRYPHGVMTECLPDGTPLPDSFALQHPGDYVDTLIKVLKKLLAGHSDWVKQVVGIGIDFTQCTMMPVDEKGIPLCFQEEYKTNPYAWVKLWKHHGAEPQAKRLTEVARQRKEAFLAFCGEEIYAETMFPKILETYERAPEIYNAADSFIELADWITFYLTGSRKRSCSIAGCAALWRPEEGYPTSEYFEAVASGFGRVAEEKLTKDLVEVGEPVGFLSKEKAEMLGLQPGLPVAAGLGDCQAAFIGVGLHQGETLLSVMGTSSCDMLIHNKGIGIPGMYGVSYGSMVKKQYGYEAGQATMGDLFSWFIGNCIPEKYFERAKEKEISIFDYLNSLAEEFEPGDTGLLVLDWWNGNRSVLLDTDLSGMILGMDLETKCEEIYLALSEGLAFGKKRIIQQFRQYGILVKELYMTGGVANKNPFLMQLFADIIGLPVKVSAVENGSCLGSAIYGMAAGGGFEDLSQAASAMGQGADRIYLPNTEKREIYEILYQEYETLYHYFGQENMIMHRLKERKRKGEKV